MLENIFVVWYNIFAAEFRWVFFCICSDGRPYERSTTMGFFDDVINTTKSVAASAGKKTDGAVQMSKLKIRTGQLNNELKEKFEKLGNLAYNMAKNGGSAGEEYNELIAGIDACYVELEEAKSKMDVLKDLVICPGCGNKVKNDNTYCPNCGAKLEAPAQQPTDGSDGQA